MKTGRGIEDLAHELQRQAVSKRDFLAPTDQLEMVVNDQNIAVIAGLPIGPVGLAPYAHKQVGQETMIPGRYYDRMLSEAPQLLAENVNHWFKSAPKKRLVRTLDGSVRGFLSDKFRPLDNFDLAEAALPVFVERGIQVRSCEVTDTRLYLKGVLPSLTREVTGSVRKGDIVSAGIMISNSEVGAGALKIEDFFEFLACINGMVMTSTFKRTHIGRAYGEEDVRELLTSETKRQNDKAFWMTIRDLVANAFNEESFSLQVEKMSLATQQKIEGDPVKAIEQVQEIYTLKESTQGNILRHLIEGGDLSRWGVINAVTRSAEDEESYETATDLERVGGAIVELSQPQWDRIAKAA